MITEYYAMMYENVCIAVILIMLFIFFAWLYDYYNK